MLSLFSGKERDLFLDQPISTERFDLVSGNWLQAVKVTRPIARDPEVLQALAYPRSSYSLLRWCLQQPIPNGRTHFLHPIKPQGSDTAIGFHMLRIDRSGTATLGIALTDKAWWGQGVFEEVRVGLMDHFSRSPRVVRFAGASLARNFASVYNYKKLGFRLVGHEVKAWRSPLTDELLDLLLFEYLAEDWRRARKLELR